MKHTKTDRKPRIHAAEKISLLVLLDVLSVACCYFLALLIRFEFSFSAIPTEYFHNYLISIPLWCVISVAVFGLMKLYSSIWSFVSSDEAFRIIGAYAVLIILEICAVLINRLRMPRSYYVIGTVLSFFCTLSLRFSYRMITQLRYSLDRAEKRDKDRKNVLLIGAGEAGNYLLNEFQTSSYIKDQIVCIVDDNSFKWNKRMLGVPIVGGRSCIPEMVEKYHISKIIFAIPTASAADRKEILNICSGTNCQVQVLPGVYQLVNNEVSVSKLRQVDVQDLLGRDPIHVEMDEIREYIAGKRIMVTGVGSIGSELCRQIAKAEPEMLLLFDIYENNVYDVQMELKRKYPNLQLVALIGSVRDRKRLECIMEKYRPELVFHAAAHKHVPLMEESPNEAVKNNVFGTYNIARTAAKYGVKRFVMISTDKAVNPTNIMGATKRLCEMIVQMINRHSETEFVAVRFGNVLGSSGSVVPLFKKQIEAGGPVTVTHPDVIRYFMTIPEAVSLVLQAGYYAHGGEIFVLDMGEPVKIDTMARNLIKLSGYQPDVDIKISYIGLRPGEKLFEELLMKEEGLKETDNKLIHIGKPIEMDDQKFAQQLQSLEKACEEETDRMKEIVSEIVPTYHPQTEESGCCSVR